VVIIAKFCRIRSLSLLFTRFRFSTVYSRAITLFVITYVANSPLIKTIRQLVRTNRRKCGKCVNC